MLRDILVEWDPNPRTEDYPTRFRSGNESFTRVSKTLSHCEVEPNLDK